MPVVPFKALVALKLLAWRPMDRTDLTALLTQCEPDLAALYSYLRQFPEVLRERLDKILLLIGDIE